MNSEQRNWYLEFNFISIQHDLQIIIHCYLCSDALHVEHDESYTETHYYYDFKSFSVLRMVVHRIKIRIVWFCNFHGILDQRRTFILDHAAYNVQSVTTQFHWKLIRISHKAFDMKLAKWIATVMSHVYALECLVLSVSASLVFAVKRRKKERTDISWQFLQMTVINQMDFICNLVLLN